MRPLLGTFVEIRIKGDRSRLELAVRSAFEAIERIQQLMSFHAARSDVARINAAHANQSLRVDPETCVVLRAANALSAESGGLFDVTVAPTLVREGFLPHPTAAVGLPVKGAVAKFRRGVNGHRRQVLPHVSAAQGTYRDLELLPDNQVRWRRKGWIDLGGIAKGYAVDRAVTVLRNFGIRSGVVNAGGDLRCFGAPQPIYLRSSHNPATLLRLGELRDGAIATSAGYYNSVRIRGQRCVPLVHPQRARCISLERSVSVAASTCMTADALTKVVALSLECTPTLLERFNAQAVMVDLRGVHLCGRARLRMPGVGEEIAA